MNGVTSNNITYFWNKKTTLNMNKFDGFGGKTREKFVEQVLLLKMKYSQTCEQRSPLRPKIFGRC